MVSVPYTGIILRVNRALLLPTCPQRVNVQQWAKVQHELDELPDLYTPK